MTLGFLAWGAQFLGMLLGLNKQLSSVLAFYIFRSFIAYVMDILLVKELVCTHHHTLTHTHTQAVMAGSSSKGLRSHPVGNQSLFEDDTGSVVGDGEVGYDLR